MSLLPALRVERAGGPSFTFTIMGWVGTWVVATRRASERNCALQERERADRPTDQHHICPSIEITDDFRGAKVLINFAFYLPTFLFLYSLY